MDSTPNGTSSITLLNPLSTLHSFYASFLLSNAARLSQIESSLRSLTWFVPGQSLPSEGLYTALNLLTLYHDALLSSAISEVQPNQEGQRPAVTSRTLPSSPHARYTSWWLRRSRLYKAVARLLSVLSYSQLLLEMAAKKYRGEKGRWRIVIGLETFKAVLRLILLRLTAQRTVLQPSIPERELDPSLLSTPINDSLSLSTSSSSDTWKASRTGFSIPTISSLRSGAGAAEGGMGRVESEISVFLQKKVLTIDSVRKPYSLVRKRKGLGIAAEVVWILRPLIYVLALKRYGKAHLYPFALSLSLEYFAYRNMADSLSNANRATRSNSASSEVEKQELAKRRKAFWYYLLRGPLWQGWTREKIESFSTRFGKTLGVGLLANIAEDYKGLIDDYHYYASV